MNTEIVLHAHQLTKRFGALTAVDCLDLEVRCGEVFGFLGPNGAGKTTSISMLCGLLKPDAGWVRLDGQPVTQKRARSMVGVCPQQTVLWEKLTCLEQLVYIGRLYGVPAGEARRRAQTLLAELDLAARANQAAGKLSGGMQRRLNLAMALVHDPQIVVLDAPEAGLDPQSRVMVREYLHRLAGHKTVILTTHNMDEAERLADRVAIIDHGRLLVLDTPQALKRRLGEGDVLELRLGRREAGGPGTAGPAALRAAIAAIDPTIQINLDKDTLGLRGLNLVGLLPRLLQALDELGCQAVETRLRANTLEDVFIQLTGRKLRE